MKHEEPDQSFRVRSNIWPSLWGSRAPQDMPPEPPAALIAAVNEIYEPVQDWK